METSPLLRLPPRDRSPSLTPFSLFLSFIFCSTSFQRQWAAFLGAWCPLPVFRSCFVEVAQHSNDLLMNLWGTRWSPRPIPPPSWDHLPNSHLLFTTSTTWEEYIPTHTHTHTNTQTCTCTRACTHTHPIHTHTIHILRPIFPSVQ